MLLLMLIVLGLEGYVKELWTDDDGQLFDEKIRDKIKEAVEYCRTEQCDVDNANGKLVRYCQSCIKSGKNKCNVWEIAQEVYELNYDN